LRGFALEAKLVFLAVETTVEETGAELSPQSWSGPFPAGNRAPQPQRRALEQLANLELWPAEAVKASRPDRWLSFPQCFERNAYAHFIWPG
jgi:hypothetical protein